MERDRGARLATDGPDIRRRRASDHTHRPGGAVAALVRLRCSAKRQERSHISIILFAGGLYWMSSPSADAALSATIATSPFYGRVSLAP